MVLCYALIFGIMAFWCCVLPSRREDPPAEFVLIPFGLLFALTGAILVLYPLDGFIKLGQRLVEQGTLLCFLLAYGS
jgi:hypothetical protein